MATVSSGSFRHRSCRSGGGGRGRLSSNGRGLRLRRRSRRLREILLEQRLEEQHDDERHQKNQEQLALAAGLVLRILIFGQSFMYSLDCSICAGRRLGCWPLVIRLRFHNGIVSAAHERMAAEKPGHRHPSTAKSAEAFDGFHGVFRTRGNIAAGGREHGRDRPLVASQQQQRHALGNRVHAIRLFGSRLPVHGCRTPASFQ